MITQRREPKSILTEGNEGNEEENFGRSTLFPSFPSVNGLEATPISCYPAAMHVEIFSLCEFARMYGGRLVLSAPFDHIAAPSAPIQQMCSVAIRVRFELSEVGECPFRFNVIDADGQSVIPPLQGNARIVAQPGQLTSCLTMAIGMNLTLPKPGRYSVRFALRGMEIASLPLEVLLAPRPEGPPSQPESN